jgi:hypothetical protein
MALLTGKGLDGHDTNPAISSLISKPGSLSLPQFDYQEQFNPRAGDLHLRPTLRHFLAI